MKMKFSYSPGLNTRITLLCSLLVAASCLVLLLIVLSIAREKTKQITGMNLINNAELINEKIDTEILAKINELKIISFFINLSNFEKDKNLEIIKNSKKRFMEFKSISILNLEGDVLLSTNYNQDEYEIDFKKMIINHNDISIYERKNDLISIIISTEGGYIIGEVDLSFIKKIRAQYVTGIKFGKKIHIISEKNIIAGYPEIRQSNIYKEILQKKESTFGVEKIRNQEMLIAGTISQVFGNLSGNNWLIIITQNTDIAFIQIRMYEKNMLIAGFICTVFGGFFGWLASHRIVKSIKLLTKIAKDIRQGIAVSIPNTTDIKEIRILSNALKRLLNDIEYQKMIAKDAIDKASFDQLTGVLNRYGLNLNIPQDNLEDKTVIYIDLDGFKKVNDTLGHEAGDFLLKEVCLIIQKIIDPKDLLVRWGGDEIVIVRKSKDEKEAIKIALQIIKELKNMIETPKGYAKVGASIGISLGKENIETLLNKADEAMYKSKTEGRNRYTIFE